jgi:hypothetical protein
MELANTSDDARRWTRRLTLATVIGVGCGIVGPFGSYLNGAVLTRIAYWTVMLWIGVVLLGLVIGGAVRLGRARGLSAAFCAGAGGLIGAVPVAFIAWLIGQGLWPRAVASVEPLDWYAQTLFIAAPLVAGAMWLERRPGAAQVQPARPAAADEAALSLALCLQMEDHYVRVYRASGSTLVLMSMRRALETVRHIPGAQVHRSWWVARSAVRGVEDNGRSVALVLDGGLRAPVARNRVAQLRADGWF